MSQRDLPFQDVVDTAPPVVVESQTLNFEHHIPSATGGAKGSMDTKILMAGLSMTFLILAIVYAMADFAVVFDINEFSAEYKTPVKFALSYWISYFRILFKAIIILLFVFVFIVVYDIALVGFVRPILSENIDSSKNISSFAGASDIITASKEGYFKSVGAVAENANKIVFGFINMNYAILLIMVIIPSVIFLISYVYYSVLSHEKSIAKEDIQNVLKTNFHYMAMFIICLLSIVLLYLIYTTLVDTSS